MNTTLSAIALAAIVAIGVSAAGSASASVVCNSSGDCWHTDHRDNYGRDVRLERHPDHWYFHRDWDHDTNHHWRPYHEGRGYYRDGAWVPR